MDLTKIPLNEYGHVQTRDGRPVRLLCKDLRGGCTVAAAVEEQNGGGEFVNVFHANGDYHHRESGHLMDLIPVPRKVRVRGWLNVYSGGKAFYAETREAANHLANISRIACIEIDREVTEGEGLT